MLTEWATTIQPLLDLAAEKEKHSVTYAAIAIQSLFILNGGALAALPPLMSNLSEAGTAAIAWAAIPFVAGIFVAGLCSLSAYLNFQFHMLLNSQRAGTAASQVRRLYSTAETDPVTAPSEAPLISSINFTLWSSIVTAILSMILFIIGAGLFIYLAICFPLSNSAVGSTSRPTLTISAPAIKHTHAQH